MAETNTNPPQNTTSYNYHKPSQEGLGKIDELRREFTKLDQKIQELCPHSRQRSIALTELETSAMWAIKAVVVNDPESEVAPLS